MPAIVSTTERQQIVAVVMLRRLGEIVTEVSKNASIVHTASTTRSTTDDGCAILNYNIAFS